MMFGGFFMMFFGAIALLLFIAIPIILIVMLVRPKTNVVSAAGSVTPPAQTNIAAARTCSHCGQGLQAGWSHCPHCGAPVD